MKTINAIGNRAKQALKETQKTCKSAKDQYEASNAIFGPGAVFSKLFPTKADRVAFFKTPESAEIRKLIDALPKPKAEPAKISPSARMLNVPRSSATTRAAAEPSGKILVRLPLSIHRALLMEAEREQTSLNQLILAKLSVQLQDAV